MSVDSFGISLDGNDAILNRFKKAQQWLAQRKHEVSVANTSTGKTGIVLHQETAYKQGYLDALGHVTVLIDNLSK